MASAHYRGLTWLLLGLVAGSARATDYASVDVQFQVLRERIAAGDAANGVKHTCDYTYHVQRQAGTNATLNITVSRHWYAVAMGSYASSSATYCSGYYWIRTDFMTPTGYQSPQVRLDLSGGITDSASGTAVPGVYTTAMEMQTFAYSSSWTDITMDFSESALAALATPPAAGGTYNGPDTSWWVAFKQWLLDQFTVSDASKQSLETVRGQLMTMGPWGDLANARAAAANGYGGLGIGNEQEPTVIHLPALKSTPKGTSPDLIPVGKHDIPLFWHSTAYNQAVVSPVQDGYTPWLNNSSGAGWRGTFRKIVGYGLYGMLLLAFIGYLKGRITA